MQTITKSNKMTSTDEEENEDSQSETSERMNDESSTRTSDDDSRASDQDDEADEEEQPRIGNMAKVLVPKKRGGLATSLLKDVNTITFDHACKEMRWQGAKKTGQGVKDFRDQVLTRVKPVVQIGMRKNSPFLQIIHSAARFLGDPMEEDEYNGNIIGFLGDRTSTADPLPVVLEEKWVGGWEKVTGGLDDLEIDTFYSNKENRKKCYKQGTGAEKSSVSIPHMPVVPSRYVEWLTDERRTPFELYLRLKIEFGSGENEEELAFFQPVLNFCLLACQGKCNQSFVAILDPSKDCTKWMAKRLNDTLGKKRSTRMPKQRSPLARPSVRSSRDTYEEGRRAGEADAQKSTTAPKKLKSWQKHQLMAWSGQTSKDDVAPLWDDLAELGTTDLVRARQLITKAISKAAKEFNCEISPVFLSDQIVKDILKLNLAPTQEAEFYALNEGITILEFMEKSPDEVTKLKRESKAQEESHHTRTLSEARSKNKKNTPRDPPTTIHHMKELLATYCMFLRALFTSDCQHYKTVWAVRRVLLKLTPKASKIPEETMRVLTWCIIDDSRQFFSAMIDEDDWDAADVVDMPTSLLVYHTAQLRLLLPFMPADFPDEWKPRAQRQRLEDHRSGGGGTDAEQERPGGGGYHKKPKGGAKVVVKQEPGWQSDTHPKIMAAMKTIRDTRDVLPLRQILDKGNKKFGDLPNFNTTDGRLACNRYILGRCSAPGKKCTFAHVPGTDLDDTFVNALCLVIAPGVAKLAKPPAGGAGGTQD